MQISIIGASGFIGTELIRKFKDKGHTFNIIDRDSFASPDDEFRSKKIEGSDIVINLAGATINKRWTASYKNEIYNSRILTARKISNAIIQADKKPGILISNSGIGIYNSTESHTEESSHLADDFMGKLCVDWEKEALASKGQHGWLFPYRYRSWRYRWRVKNHVSSLQFRFGRCDR